MFPPNIFTRCVAKIPENASLADLTVTVNLPFSRNTLAKKPKFARFPVFLSKDLVFNTAEQHKPSFLSSPQPSSAFSRLMPSFRRLSAA